MFKCKNGTGVELEDLGDGIYTLRAPKSYATPPLREVFGYWSTAPDALIERMQRQGIDDFRLRNMWRLSEVSLFQRDFGHAVMDGAATLVLYSAAQLTLNGIGLCFAARRAEVKNGFTLERVEETIWRLRATDGVRAFLPAGVRYMWATPATEAAHVLQLKEGTMQCSGRGLTALTFARDWLVIFSQQPLGLNAAGQVIYAAEPAGDATAQLTQRELREAVKPIDYSRGHRLDRARDTVPDPADPADRFVVGDQIIVAHARAAQGDYHGDIQRYVVGAKSLDRWICRAVHRDGYLIGELESFPSDVMADKVAPIAIKGEAPEPTTLGRPEPHVSCANDEEI